MLEGACLARFINGRLGARPAWRRRSPALGRVGVDRAVLTFLGDGVVAFAAARLLPAGADGAAGVAHLKARVVALVAARLLLGGADAARLAALDERVVALVAARLQAGRARPPARAGVDG